MHHLFIIVIYNSLYLIAWPFIILYFLMRACKGKTIVGKVGERLGFVPRSSFNNVVWFHAASVGEVLSIEKIVNNLKMQDPSLYCYITTATTSGKNIALQNINANAVSYIPFDFLPFIMIAFARIRPTKVILVESELWPNLIWWLHHKQCPLYIVNARIHKSGIIKEKLTQWFLSPFIALFEKIYVQSNQDIALFEKLGIHKEKLEYSGNIKLMTVIEKHATLVAKNPFSYNKNNTFVIMAGSIHPGEEEAILEAFLVCKKHHPYVKLVFAPRHFHWLTALSNAIENKGLRYQLWSTSHAECNADVLIVDTLGVLFNFYRYADIVLLGGTFIPIGGHNILEPLIWNVPSLVGPYYNKISSEVDELEKYNAVIKAHNQKSLKQQLLFYTSSPGARAMIQHNADRWIQTKHSAMKQSFQSLLKTIGRVNVGNRDFIG